jgi:hypothetical protein
MGINSQGFRVDGEKCAAMELEGGLVDRDKGGS